MLSLMTCHVFEFELDAGILLNCNLRIILMIGVNTLHMSFNSG